MTARRAAIVVGLLALPLDPASADESYRHARVRLAEPLVTLQSAAEPGAEEAVPNMPFLPGDRMWTDARGRAELHFADGTLVRVDSRSKLDYDGYDPGSGGQVVLRLWSGSLFVHQRERGRSPEFVVETPSAAATLHERGVYRIDVDVQGGETRLSVLDGNASLDAADRVRVRAGERAFARRGERPWGPERLERDEADDFARWDAQLGDEEYAGRRHPYLPEEVSPFAEDFDRHGSWYFETGVGNVWRPQVPIGWQPYAHGRWAWTAYGWTWVPSEPWGWAPYHYGRWDHSLALGWYWVPGRTWGPAWVSWSAGNGYVGWCPLGYRDRPVVVHAVHAQERGRAVPRAGVAARNPWTYVRQADLGARDVAVRRVDAAAVPATQMHLVDLSRARITREGTVAEGAVPRNVRTRPGVGDTVPELRTDNTTTIPFAVPRTRYESEREREQQEAGAVGRSGGRRVARGAEEQGGVRQTPTDVLGWSRSFVAAADQPAPEPTPSPEAIRRRPERSRSNEGDREALRPWFRKLTQPRDEDRSGSQPRDDQATPRPRPRSEDAAPPPEPREMRAEPKRERQERVSPPPPPPAPPPPPSNEGGSGRDRGATRRDRNRDHQ